MTTLDYLPRSRFPQTYAEPRGLTRQGEPQAFEKLLWIGVIAVVGLSLWAAFGVTGLPRL